MLLADFGADVVKVELPGAGDPLRQWTAGGHPFWWNVYARNKRLVTLNLKQPEGRDLLRRLLPRFDVMIESFVPGTLESLDLGWEVLKAWHPRLILLRISGWGQTGPDSQRPGFGTLVEAASGFAAMNGEPDGPPIVPSFPLADSTAGLYAANAVMFALYHQAKQGGEGQQIDVSLFESLFSLLGPLPAEYAAFGIQRYTGGQPVEERRAARLLRHERRRLDCRECVDSEDGRAVPPLLRPGTPARGLALRDQRRTGGPRWTARRGHRGCNRIEDGGRERRHHRREQPHRDTGPDRRGHHAAPSLAVAGAHGRCSGGGKLNSDAQRDAAPV